MTHSSHSARERIIERLDTETGDADWDDLATALRAVLDVHWYDPENDGCGDCCTFAAPCCTQRAIAEVLDPAVDPDPVEAKARELAKAGGVDFDEQEPEGVEMLIGMALHVLGQESDR